jgi:hypothetical protein
LPGDLPVPLAFRHLDVDAQPVGVQAGPPDQLWICARHDFSVQVSFVTKFLPQNAHGFDDEFFRVVRIFMDGRGDEHPVSVFSGYFQGQLCEFPGRVGIPRLDVPPAPAAAVRAVEDAIIRHHHLGRRGGGFRPHNTAADAGQIAVPVQGRRFGIGYVVPGILAHQGDFVVCQKGRLSMDVDHDGFS